MGKEMIINAVPNVAVQCLSLVGYTKEDKGSEILRSFA